MGAETIRSSEACRLVRQLEELLERRVACVALVESDYELAFLMSGDGPAAATKELLLAVAEAACDASKSL